MLKEREKIQEIIIYNNGKDNGTVSISDSKGFYGFRDEAGSCF